MKQVSQGSLNIYQSCRHSTLIFRQLCCCFPILKISLSLSELTRCIHAVLFVLNKSWVVLNVRGVKVSNENGHLSRNISIVFQPTHPDTGSPLVRGASDCSASGIGYAL